MRQTLTIVTLSVLSAIALAPIPSATADERAPLPHRIEVGGSFLGVELRDLDDGAAAESGIRGSGGVSITRVLEDSAAAEAGVESGDVLLSFDGERVRSASHLSRLVRETPPGRTVELTVLRGGRELSLEAKLREGRVPGLAFAPGAPMPPMPAMPPMPGYAPHAHVALLRELALAGGTRWRLGIQGHDLSGQLAGHFEVEQGDGVLIHQVVEGSAAEKAGLQAGDVIVALDDQRIHSLSDLRAALADEGRDAAGSIVIVRKGGERSFRIELEKVERSGALGFGGYADPDAMRELRDRHAAESQALREQAVEWQNEARQHQRELRKQQRELQRELGDQQRALQQSRPL